MPLLHGGRARWKRWKRCSSAEQFLLRPGTSIWPSLQVQERTVLPPYPQGQPCAHYLR